MLPLTALQERLVSSSLGGRIALARASELVHHHHGRVRSCLALLLAHGRARLLLVKDQLLLTPVRRCMASNWLRQPLLAYMHMVEARLDHGLLHRVGRLDLESLTQVGVRLILSHNVQGLIVLMLLVHGRLGPLLQLIEWVVRSRAQKLLHLVALMVHG